MNQPSFRDYDECMNYIRQSNSIKAPEGGLALPLPYTVYEPLRKTSGVLPVHPRLDGTTE